MSTATASRRSSTGRPRSMTTASLLYSSFDVHAAGSAPAGSDRARSVTATRCTSPTSTRIARASRSSRSTRAATFAPYGYALRDAATGEVLYGDYTGRDTGRGMIGDVDPTVPGHRDRGPACPAEPRAARADGTELGAASAPGTNQSIRWAADLTTQIVNGSGDGTTDDRRPASAGGCSRRPTRARTTAPRAPPRSWPTSSATGARSLSCAPPIRRRCASTSRPR